jgi:hypothetical protein
LEDFDSSTFNALPELARQVTVFVFKNQKIKFVFSNIAETEKIL